MCIRDRTNQAVYVVGPGGMVSERMVQVGPLSQGLRVIRSGLAASDVVVIDGLQRVHAGHAVSPHQGTIVATPAAPADAGGSYIEPPSTSAKLADPGG